MDPLLSPNPSSEVSKSANRRECLEYLGEKKVSHITLDILASVPIPKSNPDSSSKIRLSPFRLCLSLLSKFESKVLLSRGSSEVNSILIFFVSFIIPSSCVYCDRYLKFTLWEKGEKILKVWVESMVTNIQ